MTRIEPQLDFGHLERACYGTRVNALAERWPKLDGLARVQLASLPTPIEPLARISERVDSEVWVKRDDLTAARYGGNKVRKLEYLLGAAKAQRVNTLITTGAVGSHHVFATALYGRELGFETYAALTPQPYQRHVEELLRADLVVGAHLYPAESLAEAAKIMLELSVRLRFWGRRPQLVPLGGSNVQGTLAFVNAGLELAQQIDAGACPDIDALYVATGSAATVSGLALGLAAGGIKTHVVGVRALRGLSSGRLHIEHLIKQADHVLRTLEPRFPDVALRAFASISLDDDELGPGYGLSTPASLAAREFAASEGLVLDETYTSKALAALLRDARGVRRGQRLLYWHTLSSASLEPFLVDAPEAPERFVKLMTLG
ncbi:MAG: D-cysteine desulfhydrase [Myxococcaceae bacterium]|nr:D-cysteine desulfhydrase [Myxococcaceae bacterium]